MRKFFKYFTVQNEIKIREHTKNNLITNHD